MLKTNFKSNSFSHTQNLTCILRIISPVYCKLILFLSLMNVKFLTYFVILLYSIINIHISKWVVQLRLGCTCVYLRKGSESTQDM